MKIFIEFWKAKETWHRLSKEERLAYVAQIGPVMEDLISKGVLIDAWGTNQDTTEYKADFDFYAVTKFPSEELLLSFQNIVEQAKWYEYFDQINVSGDNLGADAVIGKMISL